MPQLILSIDEIARQKQRDVIYVEFRKRKPGGRLDYRLSPPRNAMLDLFTANEIPFFECGGIGNDADIESYQGQIYVDVAFDESTPLFKTVVRLLTLAKTLGESEKPHLYLLKLSTAMKNAHLDEAELS